MLSDRELKVYQALDGKQHRFILLNVDVHDHSKLLAKRKPQVTKVFYKLAEKFFQLAVDLNHGIAAPWQGDGGFAIFCTKKQDAFNSAWNAASEFLVPFQNSILRSLERECGAAIGDQWRTDYPQYYCVIDSVEFVYDYNQPGTWCGAELSQSLKEFKKMARPNNLAITKRAYLFSKDQEFWKSKGLKAPKGQKIYFTKSFGQELIISNPDYRDRIYRRQADNIAARNMLTEFLIEKKNFNPNQFLMAALHCLAKVFKELDYSDIGFRASVWKKCGGYLEFAWGYPKPESFVTPTLKGDKSRFQFGKGCAGYVWKTGKPLLLTNVSKAKSFVKKHPNHTDKSAAFFPILPKDGSKMPKIYSPNQLIGVLCLSVAAKSRFKFKPVDKPIIETYVTPFALNIGLALELMSKVTGAHNEHNLLYRTKKKSRINASGGRT